MGRVFRVQLNHVFCESNSETPRMKLLVRSFTHAYESQKDNVDYEKTCIKQFMEYDHLSIKTKSHEDTMLSYMELNVKLGRVQRKQTIAESSRDILSFYM